jgi:fructose-1,6-bisphosphatase/inositol monophosphatase family enzyme
VAHRCAAAAATILREASELPRLTYEKGATIGGRSDIVTATDPAIERAVSAILRTAYPDHGLLGEETGGEAGESGWLWVIDPIDGTRNFSRGIPLVFFNLALAYNGRPVLGLTADPLRDEVFYAEAGGGATLNGVPLRAHDAPTLAEAILCVDLGLDDARGRALLMTLHDLFPGVQAVRIVGSAALGLAYVAAGRVDAYIHPSPYAWDLAPGMLLVTEAGGTASQLDGTPLTLGSRSVVASGPAVHAELVERFRHVADVRAPRSVP